VVIAAPPGRERALAELAPQARVVTGGDTRAESVASALEAVDTDLVAIHDAARPLATAELFDHVVAKLASHPGADGVIAATPITDTVKRARAPRPETGEMEAGGPTIARTESRDQLWAAQTPQAFRVQALREALGAEPRASAATDEAMLVEEAGGVVLIAPAPARNLKVTTADDLRVAAALLSR
jgi:2-C-methyl-D-erythritol 4-phosphate cytidylyltransferase